MSRYDWRAACAAWGLVVGALLMRPLSVSGSLAVALVALAALAAGASALHK